MKKALGWKAILLVAVILAAFVGFIFYMAWIWNTQGQISTLSQISLFVAIIAAIVALWSLKTTRDSLELSRTTTRPFLNIKGNVSRGLNPDINMLIIVIENTGKLPGDDVKVDCSWYIESTELTKQCTLKVEKPGQSIIFPSEKAESMYLVEGKENVDNLTHKGSSVKVTVNYQNKLTGQQHTTRRTFSIEFTFATPSIRVAQAIVVPEKDYWD